MHVIVVTVHVAVVTVATCLNIAGILIDNIKMHVVVMSCTMCLWFTIHRQRQRDIGIAQC